MRSLNNGKSHTFHWGHYSNVGVSLICETYFTNHWFLSITWTFFLIAFFQSVFQAFFQGKSYSYAITSCIYCTSWMVFNNGIVICLCAVFIQCQGL